MGAGRSAEVLVVRVYASVGVTVRVVPGDCAHIPAPSLRHHQFFKLYTELLRSDNYVTRRQSLKLLGELLLDRSNVKIMMQVAGRGGAGWDVGGVWVQNCRTSVVL